MIEDYNYDYDKDTDDGVIYNSSQSGYVPPVKAEREGGVYGVMSFVFGMGAVMLFLMLINIPMIILAVIFGCIQISGYSEKRLAVAGIILGIISFIMMVTSWVMIGVGVA